MGDRGGALPGWVSLVGGGRVAAGAEELRSWGLSSTWRIRWDDGSTVVVKRGSGEEALALDVYEQVLIPGRISAPGLLAAHRGDGFVVMMFEDAGERSLAEAPTPEGWAAAARLLARLRREARGRVDEAGPFRFGAEEILGTWRRAAVALGRVRPDLAGALDRCGPLVGPHLRRLAATVPATIVHGDFEAKNIMLTDAGPCAIDWSTAQVGAHLGDLYSLVRDAGRAGGPVDGVVAAYAEECGSDVDLDWQLALGGMVWTLRALRWVLEEGVHVLPEAATWIDELVERAGRVGADLAATTV